MKKPITKSAAFVAVLFAFVSCSNDDFAKNNDGYTPDSTIIGENLIVCNEGNFQSDNGQLSYYNCIDSTLTNGWFRQVNGTKLGDTPNDIIQVNDTLIAIAVNWSNIIQFMRPDGTACGATEEIPNNRRMCSDGKYLYVTSYAHRCGTQTFEKGYVAKIDVTTKKIVATCEVGWEPEGVRLYDGRLYVANTGGYSYSESHEYETTLHVLNAETMTPIDTIDTGHINLYSEMSQSGKYLCVNSPGDYYSVGPATIIIDCETHECTTFDFPCTYNTAYDGKFYTVGSNFSYLTGEYVFYIKTIDPETKTATDGVFCDAITDKIKTLAAPYELYVSPYTGNVYFTDADTYASPGTLYGYTQDGRMVFAPQELYINPAHILALPVTK